MATGSQRELRSVVLDAQRRLELHALELDLSVEIAEDALLRLRLEVVVRGALRLVVLRRLGQRLNGPSCRLRQVHSIAKRLGQGGMYQL